MGCLAGVMEAQYNVLRKNGHSPSEAFNETVEELTQSLIRLVAQNGMDWMYANCSTTAQRGALDWAPRFRDAVVPLFDELYESVTSGKETKRVLDCNSARTTVRNWMRSLRSGTIQKCGGPARPYVPYARKTGANRGFGVRSWCRTSPPFFVSGENYGTNPYL